MNRPVLTLSLLSLLLLSGCAARTGPASTPEASGGEDLSESLPWDPAVRRGVLDNGLQWFVEPNAEPADRLVLRLVVDVGSVLEDEDQLGLAHFLEHMAFNGTENFEGNELITYLESIGTKFGAHLNAHTSFDETVYKLQIPTDSPELVDKGFLVLRDWAGGMLLDPEEIEKERGVVIEEWRRRLGPQQRSWEVTLPLTYGESPYPERLPIGTEESLKTFEHEALRRFYTDWYRPDLMAMIAVGDVDPELMEKKIVALFSDLPAPGTPRERTRPSIPSHADTQAVVFTDPELTRASFYVASKVDDIQEPDHGAYRRTIVRSLVHEVLNERLGDRADVADPPFLRATAGNQRLTPTEGMQMLVGVIRSGGIMRGLEAVLVELKRAQVHGFSQAELDRAKARRMRQMESALKEDANTSSSKKVGELIRHFTTGESVPGLAYEYELFQRWVPGITTDEASSFARSWLTPESRIVVASQPQVDGLEAPTEEEVLALVAEIDGRAVDPLEEEESASPLLESPPTPGTLVSEERSEELDMTTWTLSNGAKVSWKVTDFKEDEIRLTGWSPGGSSRAEQEQLASAQTAVALLRESGLGELSASQLKKQMAGKKVSLRTGVGWHYDTVSGNAESQDLETLFQLLWLGFTSPRFDPEAFERLKATYRAQLENRLLNPATVFGDERNRLLWQDHPRRQPWTVETIEKMDLAISEAFYRERFGDASDFHFFFVGNIDRAVFEPLVLQYIAALPASGEGDSWTDRGDRKLPGRHETVVRAGSDPKAIVDLHFHGPFESSRLSRNRLSALGAILAVRLREELREELGGVYGVSARARSVNIPSDEASVTIRFQCDPQRVDELKGRALEVVGEFLEGPIDESYVAQEQEKRRRSHQLDLEKNTWWLNGLSGAVKLGEDPRVILDYLERVDSLTPGELHEVAGRHLDLDQLFEAVLLPEEAAQEP